MRGCEVNMVLHYVSDQEVLETVTYIAGNPVSLTGDMTSLGTLPMCLPYPLYCGQWSGICSLNVAMVVTMYGCRFSGFYVFVYAQLTSVMLHCSTAT